MKQNVVEANRERTLYLFDGSHIYYVPQGWCDDFSSVDGGDGLNNLGENGVPEPEIYCYAPLYIVANSAVDTFYVKVDDLQKMEEVTEDRAKAIHPALFDHLDKINSGG